MEKKASKGLVVLVTAIITFVITIFGMYFYFIKNENGRHILLSQYLKSSEQSSDIKQKIDFLTNIINKQYTGQINEDKLVQGALKGYISGLEDEYSEYLTEIEYQDLLIDVTNDYVGIGVYIAETVYDEVVILAPIKGSPAEEAGLQTLDYIIKINGEDCANMDIEEASQKIKGEEGTAVELEIKRGEEYLTKTIERRTVELQVIDSNVLENSIGYIQIISFSEDVTTDVSNILEEFEEKNINKIIIDVRNNGGGLVNESITLSELFLNKDDIIMHVYDKENNDQVIGARYNNSSEKEIVILINENSASATEIFAAALKENEKATLVGTKTFGKGVMQSVIKIPFGGALKITSQEFKTPKGEKINELGIEPNIIVELDETDSTKDTQLEKAMELLK